MFYISVKFLKFLKFWTSFSKLFKIISVKFFKYFCQVFNTSYQNFCIIPCSKETRGWINFEGKVKVMWQKQTSEAKGMRRAKQDESPPARQILNVIESCDMLRILSLLRFLFKSVRT